MAMVPTYKRENSVPGSTEMQNIPLSLASSPLSDIGEGITKIGAAAGKYADAKRKEDAIVATRIQTREDLINSQRATELFNQREDMEVEKFIKDPKTDLLTTGSVQPYTDAVQLRVQEAVDAYSLSEGAKAELYAKLSGLGSTSIRNIMKQSIAAQDDFTTSNAISAARFARSAFDTLPPTPENITAEANAATNAILDNELNLSSPKARELILQQVEKVYVNGFNKVFASGDLKASEDFVNSGNFRKNVTEIQLRSAISSIQDEKKERSAGLRAAKRKRAEFEYWNGRPPTEDEALVLSGMARVKPQSRGEFKKLVDDALRLESQFDADKLAVNNEYQLIKKRIEYLTRQSNDGLSIRFNDNGTVSTIAQGKITGIGSQLPPTQALDQKAQLDNLDSTLASLDTIIGQITTDKSTAGFTGSLKSWAQKIVGVSEDAAPEAIVSVISQAANSFGLGNYFNKNLPEQDVYQNTIALQLAKLRVSAGGTNNPRAIKPAFDAARKDMSLRGLSSSREVVARLGAIRKEFKSARDKLVQRLSGSSPTEMKSVSPEGTTATNPTTGQQLITKNGFWVPL